MILILGPAGSGKSLQGQFLAIRHGWTWVSVGRLLRRSNNLEIENLLKTGDLLPNKIVDHTLFKKLDEIFSLDKVIVDGYPRSLAQAKSLVSYVKKRNDGVGLPLIINLALSDNKIIERLSKRGRMDDKPEAVKHRLSIYHQKSQAILDYYAANGVAIETVDADGKPGEVFDRIEAVIDSYWQSIKPNDLAFKEDIES